MKLRFPYRRRPRSSGSEAGAVGADRRLPRRSLAVQVDALARGGWEPENLGALCEFVDDDPAGEPADPVFKERLRLDLWWLIVTRLETFGPHG